MSHFAVMVISAERPTEVMLDRLLAPFHEFECTGVDNEFVVNVDETEEALEEYAKATEAMIAAPDGVTFYGAYDDRFYRDPTPEEEAKWGPLSRGTGAGDGISWTSKDWGDGRGYRTKVHEVPADHKEINVPTKDVQPIAQWIEHYYGIKPVVVRNGAAGLIDREGSHKYGYALVDEAGNLIKLVDRTNPNKKWDWWQLGGRFTGMFKPHYDPDADPSNKETCFLCNGTGKRADMDVKDGCNGCAGTGTRTKWPTQWKSIGDVAQVKDVPLEALRNIAESAALTEYDKAVAIVAGRELPSWSALLARAEAKEISYDQTRDLLWKNPVILDLQSAGFDGLAWNVDAFLDGLRLSRPEHATRARRRAVQTFAVLKDGKWFERGEMGWWGVVHNKKDGDQWDEEFASLLDGLPPETWLAVVDCHI
jgi:hypothetical protein